MPSLFDAGLVYGRPRTGCSLGDPEKIPFLAKQTRLTFARCGIIDPLSLDDYKAHGGLKGLQTAIAMTPADIVKQVTESGLRGRGGAGFPTGIKWKTVLDTTADRKYIVCNADEGDSGTFADRMIMEGDPFVLIEGMAIAGIATGATKGYRLYPLGISACDRDDERRPSKSPARRRARRQRARFAQCLRHGNPRPAPAPMSAARKPRCSTSLEGKRGLVRAKPPLPAHKGLFGKPTVINNVISLASVPIIMDKGAAFYKDFGMGRSRGTIPIQIAGNVKHGGLFEAAFGLTLGEIVDEIGGGTAIGRPVKAVQVGGPLGAYFPRALFDTPFDYEAFAARDGLIGHAGIVVFDDTADMLKQARFAMEFCAIESCGKCTPCRIGSTRGVETLDRIASNIEPEKNLELVTDLCNTMKFGSLCALGGFTPYPVMSALNHFPDDFGRRRSPKQRNRSGRYERNIRSQIAGPGNRLRHAGLAVRKDGDADRRRPVTSPCRKAPRSCAPRWRRASKSRNSARPTCWTRSAPAASAWSRSTAAAARRRPARRRSARAWWCTPQTERLSALRRGVMELYVSDHPLGWNEKAGTGDSEFDKVAQAVGLTREPLRRRGPQPRQAGKRRRARQRLAERRLHRPRRVEPVFHLRSRRNASSARAACAPARRCKARSR